MCDPAADIKGVATRIRSQLRQKLALRDASGWLGVA